MKSKVQEAEEPGSSSLQFLPSHPRYYPDSTDIATMARPSHQPRQPYSHLSAYVSDDMNSLPLLSFRMVPVDPLDSGFSDVKLTIFTLCPLLVEGFCAPRSQCGESTRRVVPWWASQALECGTQSLPGCLPYNLLGISLSATEPKSSTQCRSARPSLEWKSG